MSGSDINFWDVEIVSPGNYQNAEVNRPSGNGFGNTVEVVIKWILPNNPGGTSTKNVYLGDAPSGFFQQTVLYAGDFSGVPDTFTFQNTIPAGTTSPYYQTVTVTTNAQLNNYSNWLDGYKVDVFWGFYYIGIFGPVATNAEYTDS
jgi:hypothetical protein